MVKKFSKNFQKNSPMRIQNRHGHIFVVSVKGLTALRDANVVRGRKRLLRPARPFAIRKAICDL